MTLQHLFEGKPGNAVAQGTNATQANTGAIQAPNVPSGGLMIFDAASARQGLFGLKIQSSTAGATSIRMPAESTVSMDWGNTTEIEIPTPLPSGSDIVSIHTVRHASGTILRWNVDSAGHLTLNRVTGASIAMGTHAAGTKLRVTSWGTVGTSTTGVLHARCYPTGSGTIISGATHDSTNSDLGTAPPVSGDLGVTGTFATSFTLSYDSDQWSTTAAEMAAVPTNLPPTVSVGSSVTTAAGGGTVTLAATASDPDGTIASYAWTVQSVLPASTLPTITNPSSANASVAVSNPGRYIIRCTVTDNGGATAYAEKKIFVPVDTNARPILDLANAGAWSLAGGSASAAAALADESDTTLTQGPTAPASEAVQRVLLQPQTTPTTWSMDVKHKLASAGSATCKLRLYEVTVAPDGTITAATQRKEWTLTPTTTAATTTVSLTSGEIATVTQWNEIMIEMSEL